jgi:hypothetical protein
VTTALRDHLQGIYSTAGRLTPELVLDDARDPDSPLHDRFEWDDTLAAEKYRRGQAADLIRSVRITYTTPDQRQEKVRAFHAVTRADGLTYAPTAELAADPFMARLMLQSAEREWKALHSKYAHLAEFVALVRDDVEAVA